MTRAVLHLAAEGVAIIMLRGFSLPVTLRDRNLLSSLSVSSWPSKGESLNMKMIITPVANLKKYTKYDINIFPPAQSTGGLG